MQTHRAYGGEFQRGVDQAHQDLVDARCVADDEAGTARPEVDAAGETLLVGPRLHDRRHAIDQLVQVEGRLVELEASGLEL